jgi:hypothetical protein
MLSTGQLKEMLDKSGITTDLSASKEPLLSIVCSQNDLYLCPGNNPSSEIWQAATERNSSVTRIAIPVKIEAGDKFQFCDKKVGLKIESIAEG